MDKIYIVVREYDENLAKRQPWYSVKKIISDLNSRGALVEVLPSMDLIPVQFTGCVIKIFSIKDIFLIKRGKYRLAYLMTFPVYGMKKLLSLPFRTVVDNWIDLKRVLVFSLLPLPILKIILMRADFIITISDRSEKYLSKIVSTRRYIPFVFDNWGVTKDKDTLKVSKDLQTIGYFGPPFSTRSFDDVVNFFAWLNFKGHKFNKKIITRIERDELKDLESKYLSEIRYDNSLEVVSGFLDRESLVKELLEVDVLILPFKIVMSELPIVSLEALELGIPVVTTKDSGIEKIVKSQENILILDDFKENTFEKVLGFIHKSKKGNFEDVRTRIEGVNNTFLNDFFMKQCTRTGPK